MSQYTEQTSLLAVIREADKPRSLRSVWRQHWLLYAMLVPALIQLILFNVLPLWGIAIAFVDFNPIKGLSGSPYVGLTYFQQMFTMREFWPIVRNTIFIAVNKIIWGQFAAVTFALMLHEVRWQPFRRVVQTLTTLPNFLSWVIVGGILLEVLSVTGIVNDLLQGLGFAPVKFFANPALFPWTLIISDVWKGFGFGAIIYLAALTAISPELYEAAAVDGAGRWARLWHITLPGIAPTIVLLSCLSLGSILSAGFDQILILQNPLVYSTGDVLDTFVYRQGILRANYSLSTAVGLVKSLVGFVLVLVSWWLAGKYANYRVF